MDTVQMPAKCDADIRAGVGINTPRSQQHPNQSKQTPIKKTGTLMVRCETRMELCPSELMSYGCDQNDGERAFCTDKVMTSQHSWQSILLKFELYNLPQQASTHTHSNGTSTLSFQKKIKNNAPFQRKDPMPWHNEVCFLYPSTRVVQDILMQHAHRCPCLCNYVPASPAPTFQCSSSPFSSPSHVLFFSFFHFSSPGSRKRRNSGGK